MTPELIAAFKVDRAGWAAGPWDSEPDRLDFHHEGFACLALRSVSGGNWCGYVGIPATHPDYQRDYNDVEVDCHGGLTYGKACDGSHICHVPQPGEPDDLWWFGFDCHHAWDVAPGFEARMQTHGIDDFHDPQSSYKTLNYVRNEIESLATQLRARA